MKTATTVGLYDAAKGNVIKVHAAGCAMLNTASKRIGRVDADEIEDARGRGFKIVNCGCVPCVCASCTNTETK